MVMMPMPHFEVEFDVVDDDKHANDYQFEIDVCYEILLKLVSKLMLDVEYHVLIEYLSIDKVYQLLDPNCRSMK